MAKRIKERVEIIYPVPDQRKLQPELPLTLAILANFGMQVEPDFEPKVGMSFASLMELYPPELKPKVGMSPVGDIKFRSGKKRDPGGRAIRGQKRDRVERLRKILEIAREAFDNLEKGVRWLQEPNIQTGNRPPLHLVGTPKGFAAVETVLRQIQYGVIG